MDIRYVGNSFLILNIAINYFYFLFLIRQILKVVRKLILSYAYYIMHLCDWNIIAYGTFLRGISTSESCEKRSINIALFLISLMIKILIIILTHFP